MCWLRVELVKDFVPESLAKVKLTLLPILPTAQKSGKKNETTKHTKYTKTAWGA